MCASGCAKPVRCNSQACAMLWEHREPALLLRLVGARAALALQLQTGSNLRLNGLLLLFLLCFVSIFSLSLSLSLSFLFPSGPCPLLSVLCFPLLFSSSCVLAQTSPCTSHASTSQPNSRLERVSNTFAAGPQQVQAPPPARMFTRSAPRAARNPRTLSWSGHPRQYSTWPALPVHAKQLLPLPLPPSPVQPLQSPLPSPLPAPAITPTPRHHLPK
jgi:hypothetical protein